MIATLCLVLILSLVGCGKKNQFYEEAVWDTEEYAGVSVKVENSSSTGISVTLENETGMDFLLSGWCHIQVKIQEGADHHDVWYEVKKVSDAVSAADGDRAKEECVINWSEVYGELPAGYDYRIGIILDSNVDSGVPVSTWAYFHVE